jgi:hypothetical protein
MVARQLIQCVQLTVDQLLVGFRRIVQVLVRGASNDILTREELLVDLVPYVNLSQQSLLNGVIVSRTVKLRVHALFIHALLRQICRSKRW